MSLSGIRSRVAALCTSLGIPVSHALLVGSKDYGGVRQLLAAIAIAARRLRRDCD